MNQRLYRKADQPTLYFIGVTTGKSSIMKVFPAWARYLGLGDCLIQGIDFAPHDQPEHYRAAVAFIKSDPLSLGALVTTHKIDLLKACRDQFDELDEFAALMGEVSSISKRDGRLVGHAKDPITSGLSLEAFLPGRHWEKTGAEAFVLGAGGSAIAITWHLLKPEHGANRPDRIVVANRSTPRLKPANTSSARSPSRPRSKRRNAPWKRSSGRASSTCSASTTAARPPSAWPKV